MGRRDEEPRILKHRKPEDGGTNTARRAGNTTWQIFERLLAGRNLCEQPGRKYKRKPKQLEGNKGN